MAGLTWAVLAIAFGTLVSGFFIRTSSLPLLVSIGFSVVVFLLILFGWSRRLRASGEMFEDGPEEQAQLEELQIVEVDETEIFAPKAPRRREAASATMQRTEQIPEIGPGLEHVSEDGGSADRAIAKKPARSKPAPRKKGPAKKPPSKRTPARGAAASRSKSAQREPAAPRVLVIPGRERFHTAGCRFAKGDDVREVSEATARRRGYVACSVCHPGSS